MASGRLKPGEIDAVLNGEAPLAAVESASEELAPELAQEVAETYEAAVVAHLHPLLREALQHDLARSDLSIRTAPKEGFSRQAQLLDCINDINQKLEDLWQTQVERKKGYLSERAGEDLMNLVTIHGPLLSEGGMYERVFAALKVFARTKLREAAKAASSEPFNSEEFERERVLHKIMERILKGPTR